MLSFGIYPDASLKDARNRRDEARKLLVDGIDPTESRKAQVAVKQLDAESRFEAVALEWFDLKIKPLSASHSNRAMTYLKNDLVLFFFVNCQWLNLRRQCYWNACVVLKREIMSKVETFLRLPIEYASK